MMKKGVVVPYIYIHLWVDVHYCLPSECNMKVPKFQQIR